MSILKATELEHKFYIFSTSSPKFIFLSFGNSHSKSVRCEVNVVLISIPLMIGYVERLFMCLLAVHMSSLGVMSVQVLYPLFNWVVFWMLRQMNSLYILDVKLLTG